MRGSDRIWRHTRQSHWSVLSISRASRGTLPCSVSAHKAGAPLGLAGRSGHLTRLVQPASLAPTPPPRYCRRSAPSAATSALSPPSGRRKAPRPPSALRLASVGTGTTAVRGAHLLQAVLQHGLTRAPSAHTLLSFQIAFNVGCSGGPIALFVTREWRVRAARASGADPGLLSRGRAHSQAMESDREA